MHVVKLVAVVEDPASGRPETAQVVLAMLIDELLGKYPFRSSVMRRSTS